MVSTWDLSRNSTVVEIGWISLPIEGAETRVWVYGSARSAA
jgi:hypothetical protein